MQEKKNVSTNTVSTTDPEEPFLHRDLVKPDPVVPPIPK
jgi:hypothetical protein